MSERVLVVGFDGATFDIIHPLVAGGRLPALAHLLKEGAWGRLKSNIPPVTPSAWTSVFTGKNPGKHGIYDFEKLDPQTYQFQTIRTDEHQEKTVWHLLGEAEKRSIIIDVPFTYPPQPLNGLMLTGYGTPRTKDTIFTYPHAFSTILPEELHAEIKVALPTFKFDRSLRFIEEWKEVMAGRQKLLNYLIQEEEWDFFMVVFSITDNMAHVFWTYADPLHPNYDKPEAETYREAFFHGYEMCDRLLAELIDKSGPDTTTLVLSDHGFGSVRPRQYIFQRLLNGGYISLKTTARNMPLKSLLLRTAVNTYNRFPFLREWVKGLQPGNRNALKRSLIQTGLIPTTTSIDYTKSLIIPSSFGLRMWVNEQDRFGSGIVPAHDKEALLQALSEYLTSDRDQATNEPVVANTYWGRDLYQGPYAVYGPDLVIEYTNFYQPGKQSAVRNPHLEGGHTLDGIFLAHGKHIKPSTITNAGLIDLAPTIMYLFDQPVPPDMDGRVILEMFTDAFQKNRPVQIGEIPARVEALDRGQYTPEEEEELKKQFRQLGYIE